MMSDFYNTAKSKAESVYQKASSTYQNVAGQTKQAYQNVAGFAASQGFGGSTASMVETTN